MRDLLWPVIQGKDPRDVAGLHDAMFATLRPWGHYRGFVQEGMSGIDQALWDIVAQAQRVPLYRALGGAARERVPVYGSKVYTAEPRAMAEEARAAVARGHHAIKIQLGRSAEWGGPNADVEVCRVIREAIGPEIAMGADVNSAYDAATAVRVCHRVAKFDLWPEIARIGGFTAAMRLGALAQTHNVKVAPHTGFSCGVAQLASLHLAAATPSLARLEWMWIANPLAEIFTTPLPQPVNGELALPERPGLGLSLDRKKLEKYALR